MRSAEPFLARQIAERAVRAAWALEVKSEERRRSVVSWPLAAVREAWFRGKPYIRHVKSPSSRGFYTKKAKNINARRMEHEDTMKLKTSSKAIDGIGYLSSVSFIIAFRNPPFLSPLQKQVGLRLFHGAIRARGVKRTPRLSANSAACCAAPRMTG